MKEQYTSTFKADIVIELLKHHKTVAQVAEETGVSVEQLNRWKRVVLTEIPRLFANGSDKAGGPEDPHLQELVSEIARLTAQLDWLDAKPGVDP